MKKTFVYVGNSPATLKLRRGSVRVRPGNSIEGPEEDLSGFSDLITLDEYNKRKNRVAQRRAERERQNSVQEQKQDQNEEQGYVGQEGTELPPWVKERREKELEEEAEKIEEQVAQEITQQEQVKTGDDLTGVEKELFDRGIWDPNSKAVNIEAINDWRKVGHPEMNFLLDQFNFPYSEDDGRWDKKKYIESIFKGQSE